MADLRDELQQSLGSAYTLGRELGGGGMSRVFVAVDIRLEREVVVKVLLPELAAGLNADRFAREIKLAASLQQANIVPVLSAGESEGLPYYTMPFVEGLSLRQRLERGPLPMAEILSVLRDVARALTYAHARGVVHRDIKPDNVLLSGDTAVVTDFGIAKAISASRTQGSTQALTQMGTAIGTPAYMAPEQAAGDASTDHRADFYAFGCLAYELLAGRTPFHGLTPHKLLVAHVSERPAPIETLRAEAPSALAALVARCLEKDPDDRPQHASDLLTALDAATTSGAIHGVAGGASERRISLEGSLGLWFVATALVALVARAAMIVLGLPDWVFPGVLAIAGLALPLVLVTWYAHHVQRTASTTTPRFTPAGTVAPQRLGTSATLALRAAPNMSWSRTTRWAIMAVAMFALGVAGFMTLRALGIGPRGSLMASGRLAESAQVLIADFNVPGADSTLGRVVSEAVRTTLGQSKVVRLLSTSAVSAALERMRKAAETRLSLDVARDIAQREGAAAVVTGDIATIGGAYVLTVRMIDARTGDLLATAQETAETANDLIPAIDRATRSLRARIGESLKTVRTATPLERATTGSLEALRAYTAALDANGRGDFMTAVAQAERAIALDSNFARAYASLPGALSNMGAQVRRQDTLRARAFALRHRVPELDRLRITESYYRQGRGYDRAKWLAAAESLTAIDPASPQTWMQLGNARARRGEFASAESAFRQSIALEPGRQLPYGNLYSNLMVQGRWAAADSLMAEAPAGIMEHRSARLARLHRAYLHGRLDSASILAREMATSRRVEISFDGGRALRALTLVHGGLAEAGRIDAELRVADAERGNVQPALIDSLSGAERDIWLRGDPPRAIRRVSAALRAQPVERIPLDERPYLALAELYALAGDAPEARRWLARHDAEVRDPDRLRQQGPLRDHALSVVAVLDRRWDDALRHAEIASRDPDGGPMQFGARAHFWRGFILGAAGRTDGAIASLERFVAAPDLPRLTDVDADFLPFTLEKLGGLYEVNGNAARAIEHYSRFVTLWKGADAELQPRVADVRNRIERLRKRSG